MARRPRHPAGSAVLSLGSNLGEPVQRLGQAVQQLGRAVRAVSSVYLTPPWGPVRQDDFRNLVVLVDDVAVTDPREWLARCRELEAAAGRERAVRWGPRTLDADVVTVGGIVSDDPELTLPHPRAHERAFVLVPWMEVDPTAHLPGHGPIADLLAGLDTTGIRKVAELP